MIEGMDDWMKLKEKGKWKRGKIIFFNQTS